MHEEHKKDEAKKNKKDCADCQCMNADKEFAETMEGECCGNCAHETDEKEKTDCCGGDCCEADEKKPAEQK